MPRYIRYKRLKQQINFLNCDDLDKWEDTCNYRLSEYYDVCDSNCNCATTDGVEPILQYRWNNINPNYGYYCENNDRYYKQRKEVSYDNGQTWLYVIPEEYRNGELYETNSKFCTSDDIMFEYKLDETRDAYCDKFNKMRYYVKNVSFDGGKTWEILTWNKPDGTIYKEYKSMLEEENSCDCGWVGYEYRKSDEYICGQDIDENHQEKYSYEIWKQYEICSNQPTGLVEYRNPQPDCDCGFSGTTFVFDGQYICGSDIESDGLVITKVTNGSITSDNQITTSGISFNNNLDIRIDFKIAEKSNVKVNFKFSNGSNIFMMEDIDSYDDFVNPPVNIIANSYNTEFNNLSKGNHSIYIRLNNQTSRTDDITLTAKLINISTEYDMDKTYEIWVEKDYCTNISTGNIEYRNGQYTVCGCGNLKREYRKSDESVCGSELGEGFEQTSKYEVWKEWEYCLDDPQYDKITGNIKYENPQSDCDCGYKDLTYIFEGEYACGSEIGSGYSEVVKYEIWKEMDLCTNELTGNIKYGNPKISTDCGAIPENSFYAIYGEFDTNNSEEFKVADFRWDRCEVYDVDFSEYITTSNNYINSESKNKDYRIFSFSNFNQKDYYGFFVNTFKLLHCYANLDFSEDALMTNMFRGCRSLKSVELSTTGEIKPTDIEGMFEGCSALTEVNLSNFDTSNVETMMTMFDGCTSLRYLDLSYLNVSNVKNIDSMFGNCINLSSLNLSNWDTSKITNMTDVFNGCTSLSSVILSNWGTSNVENFSYMFKNCSGLTTLDLSSFKAEIAKYAIEMFYGCSNLTYINMSNFIGSNITNLGDMFNGCSNLISLDLSSFEPMDSVPNKYHMFYGCNNLSHIKCKQSFKNWCITNQSLIALPDSMREGGSGNWEIVD